MQFPKSSPYKHRLNKLAITLAETGIILYWEGDLARKYNAGCGTVPDYEEELVKLSLGHVQGAFMLLELGLILSTLVFCWEILRSKSCRKLLSMNKANNTLSGT